MPNKLPRLTNGPRAGFCGLMIAGLSFADACAVVDVSQQRIHGILPEHWLSPLPHRPYKSWKGPVLDKIREAYTDSSQHADDIAARFGLSGTYLYRLASLHGWPRRKRAAILPKMSKEQRKVYNYLRGNGIPRQSAITEAFR